MSDTPGPIPALPAAWELSAPLLAPVERPADPCVSVKDPSAVWHDGRWHVFMTIRPTGLPPHTPTEYVAFEDWEHAQEAPRHVLALHGTHAAAPQVFYFRPHNLWYLIYQVHEPHRQFRCQPAYSTTTDIADPTSWTPARLLFPGAEPAGRIVPGIDFWVICDEERAYLFFTSNDGRMWRMWTRLSDFPAGFGHCELALAADIFEASHTYRLKGSGKYLTLIEADPPGRRYYKAYLADRLDGAWQPLADSEAHPFAGVANVRPAPRTTLWTDNISHGELLREGCDERMIVDPENLRFVIQGVMQKDKPAQYGLIPWRIGLLTPARAR